MILEDFMHIKTFFFQLNWPNLAIFLPKNGQNIKNENLRQKSVTVTFLRLQNSNILQSFRKS